MSTITEACKKFKIQDLAEISLLERFFANPEISDELNRAEKYRKIRYAVLIPTALCVGALILYMAHHGLWSVEVGNKSGVYRPSTIYDGIIPVIVSLFVVKGIVTAIFRKQIEGSIKVKILSKLGREIYSKLSYDQADKYAFGDLPILIQSGLINSYETIDRIEDSIGFTIDEPYKHIVVQGYELETSKTTRDSKGRRHKTTTNHCYLLRAKFPDARIELKNDLLIKTDEADNITRSWPYALMGGMVGVFFGGMLGQGLVGVIGLALISGISAVIIRRWYIGRKRVRLENTEFEKYFDVKCEDPIGSRMIVTPAFMDRLVKLASSSVYHYELLYKEDRFYIKWSVGSGYLEVNTWRNIRENMGTFVEWYAQMKEILTFVFDMRLMYYAKYQADTSKPDVVPSFDQPEGVLPSESLLGSISTKGVPGISMGGVFGGILTIGNIIGKFR